MIVSHWNKVSLWKTLKENYAQIKDIIGQVLFKNLFLSGIQLITRLKQYKEFTDEYSL